MTNKQYNTLNIVYFISKGSWGSPGSNFSWYD